MLKRKRRPPPRRQAQSVNLVSGVIYVVAVIAAIALGALFYKGFTQARNTARKSSATTADYSGLQLPPGAKVVVKTETPTPPRPQKKRSPEQLAQLRQTPGPAAETAGSPAAGTPAPSATPPPPEPTPVPVPKMRSPYASYPRSPWQPVSSDFPNPQSVNLYPGTNVGYTADPGNPAAVSGNLIVQGNTKFVLSTFDIAALKGWTLRKATWHGRIAMGRARELGFSTIVSDWDPSTGSFKSLPADTYPGLPDLVRALDKQTYAPAPEETVFRGHGASILFAAQPQPPDHEAGQWITVELDPAIVQSLIAGVSQGIAISDEAGQTGQPVGIADDADNRSFIEIEGGISDVLPPGPVEGFQGEAPAALARSRSVGVVLNWNATGDDDQRGQAFRYDLRYARDDCGFEKAKPVPLCQLPTPQPAGHPDRAVVEGLDPMVQYHFYLRAVDETGQAGPVTTTRVTTGNPWIPPVTAALESFDSSAIEVAAGGATFFVLDEFSAVNPLTGQVLSSLKPMPEAGARRSFLWDRATRTIRLRAFRNETVAFQMIFGRKSPALPPLTVSSDPLKGSQGATLNAIPALYRIWYAMGEMDGARAWIGDGMVPLDKPLQMPWPNNSIPNQIYQSVYAELPVPADAQPGLYRGRLFIGSGTEQRDTLNIFVEVANGSLASGSAFTCEWMIPPILATFYRRDASQTEEVVALEKGYLQLALDHRCQANFFPYLPNGACQPPFRPVSGSSGGQCQVESWDAWDARVASWRSIAPDIPITLPIFESWPVPFEDGYLCFDKDSRQPGGAPVYAGSLAEMEGCLHADYLRTFRSAVRLFGEHLASKDWNQVPPLVWMNNQPTTNYIGRAPVWSFGDPRFLSDFTALDLYARLAGAETRVAPGASAPPRFRVTVPQAAALRDLGAGRFDSLAVGDPNPWGWQALRARAATYNETLSYFCEALPQNGSGLSVEALGVRFFLEGADGWIIRDVVGRAENWLQARPFALVYNGLPFGQDRPYPSLRVKALRRTLQDIALLEQLAAQKGWTRRQTADFVYGFLAAQKGAGLAAPDWLQLRHAVQQLLLP